VKNCFPTQNFIENEQSAAELSFNYGQNNFQYGGRLQS